MIDRYMCSPHYAGELLATVLSIEVLQYRFITLVVLCMPGTSPCHRFNSAPPGDLTAISRQLKTLIAAVRLFACENFVGDGVW